MGGPAQREMTAAEVLIWDDGSDPRYELVDGAVVAMAPATDVHGGIVGNAWGEMDIILRRHPVCRAIVEAGIRLDERSHFKVDVAATGSEPCGSAFIEAPFLVVEVLCI